jgi:hypothetical protein
MQVWMSDTSLFLEEFIRLDGRGDSIGQSHCVPCSAPEPNYRCRDCYSRRLYCKDCLLHHHAQNLFHHVEVLFHLSIS